MTLFGEPSLSRPQPGATVCRDGPRLRERLRSRRVEGAVCEYDLSDTRAFFVRPAMKSVVIAVMSSVVMAVAIAGRAQPGA